MKKKLLFLTVLLALMLPCFATVAFTVSANDTHTVTYMIDSENVYDRVTVEDNGYLTVPKTPEKDGSVFEYWTLNGEKFSFRTRVKEDLTLVAKWEERFTFYTVEFKVGDKVVNTQKVLEGEAVLAPATIECPEGKYFVGWDTSVDLTAVNGDLVVNAILADKEYTVTIYGLNDQVLCTLSVVHGEDALMPNLSEFEVEHYTANAYVGQTENITEDTEVYVEYIADEYDITFYVESEVFEEQTVSYGEMVAFPKTTPNVENYIFIGWYEDLDGNAMYNFRNAVESGLELYAKFIPIEKPKYNVRFFDHTGVQYGGTQLIEEGQSAIMPGNPYREGYEFLGWVQDFTNITADLDVYPTYAIKSYQVTFVDEDGVVDTQTVKYGGNAIEPSSDKIRIPEGKEFAGWDGSFKNVTGDVTVTAKFRTLTFVVMFYNGSKRVGAVQYVEYGKDAKAPVMAEKVGYNFMGWNDGENTGNDVYKNITKDCVFFAEYERKVYGVEFFDGENSVYSVDVEHGESVELYLYEKTGYVFGGWFTDKQFNNAYDFAIEVVSDVTLYAKWDVKPEVTYKVKFFVDGVLYGKEQIVSEGTAAIVPATPQKEGHTFTGWDVSFDEVTSDLMVNALFEKNTYTVTFVYDGKQDVQQVIYNESATAPTDVEKEGYNFKGWDVSFDNVSGDITVKAIYEINVYTVTFYNENNVVNVQNVEYNKYASIINTPIKVGYVFAGWFNADGSAYTFSMPVSSNMEVYARFNALTYNIYYYIDGTLYYTQPVEVDTEIVAIDVPKYDDSDVIFSGWSELPEIMPAQPLVVTASTYKLQMFTLSYYVDGELYFSVKVKETDKITLIGEPDDLDEDIYFISWGTAPEIMPRGDVRVDAVIKKYYKVNYFVDGQLYHTDKVLEGEKVTLIGAPDDLAENIYFVSWGTAPEFMPQEDVRVNAQIKKYYSITYYVNGDVYYTDKILEGEKVTLIGAPTDLHETIVFIAWGSAPTIMPQEDVRVDAQIKVLQYYTLSYYLNDNLYYSVDVLEGKEITPYKAPELSANEIFSGWQNVPSVMPAKDVRVDGYITVKELKDNKFVVTLSQSKDGVISVNIAVTEKVNLAGIIASVTYEKAKYIDAVIKDESVFAFDNGEFVKFIWSNGFNTTEETSIITLTFNASSNYDLSAITLNIEQILVIDDNGETVPADYVIEYVR